MVGGEPMSTLKVNRIEPRTGDSVEIIGLDTPESPVKAWVNFNGTGTVAIRDSMNVSSITDNAVGNYTVNFTTAMSNTDYSVATSTDPALVVSAQHVAHIDNATTSGFQIHTKERRGGYGDMSIISAIVAGD
jgi:hypothetical protein